MSSRFDSPLRLIKRALFLIIKPARCVTLDRLSNLELVGQRVFIYGNDQLTDVDGLTSLEKIHDLTIQLNDALTNLDGLSSLILVVQQVIILNNPVLTDFCGLSNLFKNGEIGGSINIVAKHYFQL